MRLSEDNEEDIEAMDDPVVVEADELVELRARARAVRMVDNALGERAS